MSLTPTIILKCNCKWWKIVVSILWYNIIMIFIKLLIKMRFSKETIITLFPSLNKFFVNDINLRKKSNFDNYYISWELGITGQRITGQPCPDWLKMTSLRTSKPNIGGLSRFTFKIGIKWSDKPVLSRYLSYIYKIYILHFFRHYGVEKKVSRNTPPH